METYILGVEPQDIIKSPSGRLGSKTSVSEFEGQFIGEFNTEDEADHAIAAHMKESQFYPTVWNMSDHGNLSVDTEFYPK